MAERRQALLRELLSISSKQASKRVSTQSSTRSVGRDACSKSTKRAKTLQTQCKNQDDLLEVHTEQLLESFIRKQGPRPARFPCSGLTFHCLSMAFSSSVHPSQRNLMYVVLALLSMSEAYTQGPRQQAQLYPAR